MPAKKGNVGLDSFIQQHANDKTEMSANMGELPSGIENGVAKLTAFKFGEYERGKFQGKRFFMAMGNVVSPRKMVIDGDPFPIEGMMTRIGPEPLCDTPDRKRKTTGDHVAWMLNELRKLGLDTSNLSTQEELEEACNVLVEEGVYFRFRTWGGPTESDPNATTQHTWNGACEWEQTSSATVNETLSQNLDGAAADSGDEDAQIAIGNKAQSMGIDIDEFETWTDVLAEIKKKSAKSSGKKGKVEELMKTMTFQELGALADAEGDGDVIQAMENEARNNDIDPDEYETYEELGTVLDEAIGEEPEEEEEADLASIAEAADEGDEDAIAQMNEACEAAGIDPDEYATYAEILPELESEEEEEEPEYEEEEEEGEGTDLAALGEAADDGDEDAMQQLIDLAEEAGEDPDSYDTYVELAEVLSTEEEEEEEEEESDFVPEKGEVYLYEDPEYDEPYEVTVTYVSRKNQTVNVEDEEGTVHKGIEWSALSGE